MVQRTKSLGSKACAARKRAHLACISAAEVREIAALGGVDPVGNTVGGGHGRAGRLMWQAVAVLTVANRRCNQVIYK